MYRIDSSAAWLGRRLAIAVIIAAFAVSILGAPARAARPTIEYVPSTDSFVLPAGEFCPDFDVRVDIQQHAKIISFGPDGGGMFAAIGNGRIFATLTNLSTGDSITKNISGPAFFDDTGLPFVGTGTWFIYLPGDPGSILFLVGRFEFQPEPYGISPTIIHGRSMDMCPLL